MSQFFFLCTLILSITACVSPSHFGDFSPLQEYKQLPAIQLTVLAGDGKTKKMCVPTSTQTQYLSCFNYRDNTNTLIVNTLTDTNAFSHVNSYLLSSTDSHKLEVSENSETTQYNLVIRYHHENTDEISARRNKFLLQMLTLFFMPMEYQVKHEIKVSLYNDNTLAWQQNFVRETDELQSWYNHKLYQEAAIESMLSEMVRVMHDEKIFKSLKE